MNILLSCIGKRGYIADYFRDSLSPGSKIIGTSNTFWTPGFSSCDTPLVLPPLSSDEYIPVLINECLKHDVSGILSFYDPDVHRISKCREDFLKAGIIPVIPKYAGSLIAYDKLKTHSFLSDLNIPVPLTTKSYSIAYEFLKEQRLSFPLVVKPRFGFGSANTFIARNNLELEAFYNYAPDMIIQQFIDAEAVNIDGLGDLMSNPISIVPWKKLLSKMGETERCVTIDSPEIIRLGEQLIKSVGIIGPFDADIFRDTDGRLWVLELNLRFGGGYPVSQLAGADFPSKIIRMIRGENLESCMGAYKRGVTMMKKLEVISGPTPDCL
jgi:carbamoyl-phosphate synthase large subunit